MALCPFHAERTPSFCVYEDHFHCFGCGACGDLIDWLMRTRQLTFGEAVRYLAQNISAGQANHCPVSRPKPTPAPHNPTAGRFLRCWNEGLDPAGTIVQTYLRSRGELGVPDGAPIRFHPRCQRGSYDLPGGPEYWPAMLALMTDPITGQPVGLHRTYLLPDGSGKAPVTMRGRAVLKPKMILGTWGVVRLAPDEDIGRALAIAEGIENALTAMQIIGWGPAWAVGTQNCIRTLPLLPWIDAVTIFADADDGGVGLAAARTCARRWYAAGREAVIQIPPSGQDWNDTAQRVPHEPT
jgi:putative DNA primase/helicase